MNSNMNSIIFTLYLSFSIVLDSADLPSYMPKVSSEVPHSAEGLNPHQGTESPKPFHWQLSGYPHPDRCPPV